MFRKQKSESQTRSLSAKKFKITPIGGVEMTGGTNCTAIEYNDEIIIIDAGLGFPNADQLGVDYVIPNPDFFRKNKQNIKGLFITHAHQDHIGAIGNLLEEMNYPPVYASEFAKTLILSSLGYRNKSMTTKINVVTVNRNSFVQLNNMKVEFFGVNHSIPESMGIAVKTNEGIVIHTGDFKFDNQPLNEPQTDFAKIARYGSEGVLCLLSDSTNSYKEGYSLSEGEISLRLDKVISGIRGRVIVATFSSMVNRLLELLKIAEKYKRKVFISGRSMQLAIDTALKIGYGKFPKTLFIQKQDIAKYKDSQIMILATGAQGEDLAALGKMARNEHRDVTIQTGDTVILSASVVPGNGLYVQELIDQLSKLGANVYHNEIMNLHTTGHGHKEEQKLMINLIRPQYFMPVHGYLSFLMEHAKTAKSLGIPDKNIIIPQNGQTFEVGREGWKKTLKYKGDPVLVSGSIVGDVGTTVMDDRQQLGCAGFLVYSLLINKESGELVKAPKIISRGFVYNKQSKELFDEAVKTIEVTYQKNLSGDFNSEIKNELMKLLAKKTGRDPVLLHLVDYI